MKILFKHIINCRRTFSLCIAILIVSIVKQPTCAQSIDTLAQEIETKIDKREVYSDPTYFKDIPVDKSSDKSGNATSSYNDISKKYRSNAFNYETDKKEAERLSWLQVLLRKVDDFLENLIPRYNWRIDQIYFYIAGGIGILILAFIIYRLTLSGRAWIKEEDGAEINISPELLEKRLQDVDLKIYLDKALAETDYMAAIRYLHLINLKKLAANGRIEWDYKKTNREFLNELGNSDIRKEFEHTIRIYEYIWYGKFALSKNKFKEYSKLFRNLNHKIA